MSLPPGFIDELRTRLSLEQVVGRKVMWDSRKSNTARRDFWAPCPFHQEKSASFHVDDTKGFYYCFGCHAKGDAFAFVQQTENVGFMEAVEILAREAGMALPERDPRAQEKADENQELVDVMELAVRWFRLQLRTSIAAEARAYLDKRGLGADAQERWEIGFAPGGRTGIVDALNDKGIAPDLVVKAGLAAEPEGGGAPFDRFRDRIIYPIRDARGRAIAFGGRAMDPNARAKYLNSPETPVFKKGRSLYNHKPAREACGKGDALIVAEGYMDTIALSEAGLRAVVAPLGTAITVDQLALMWRMHPEPVIALDGDTAGFRAALRVLDLALPLLESGRSLRFAILPEGMDPDDIIRTRGAAAMRAIVQGAVPLVQLLWRRETEGKSFDSPERKAALDKVLRAAIKQIPDPSLRAHYGEDIRTLRLDLFGGARRGVQRPRAAWSPWGAKPAPYGQSQAVTPGARASAFAAGGEGMEDHLREAVILATLIRNSALIAEFEAEIDAMECRDPDHRALRDVLMRCDPDAAEAELIAKVGAEALSRLFAMPHVAIAPSVRRNDPEVARLGLAEELAKLAARRGHLREVREALEDIDTAEDERLTHRLSDGIAALDRAGRGDTSDTTEYETGANGARISRDEKDAFARLLGGIVVAKPPKRPT